MSGGQRLSEAQVFVVRVQYRNGTLLFFTFCDPAQAKRVFDGLCDAKRNREAFQFFDEAGREALIDGADVMGLVNVDLLREALSDVQVNSMVQAIMPKQEPEPGTALPRHRFPVVGDDQEPRRAGLIGAGRFAE